MVFQGSLMTVYWTLKQYPELADLPAARRKDAWNYAKWKAFHHPSVCLGALGFPAALVIAHLLLQSYSGTVMMVGATIAGLLACYGFLLARQSAIRPHFRDYRDFIGARPVHFDD